MRSGRTHLALIALTAAVLTSVVAAGSAQASTLSIRVSGNQLVDGTGNPVQFRGVNRSGTEYACVQGWGIFDGPSDAASVQAIAAWHVNIVRVLLNEDCWLGINGVNAAYAGANYQQAIVNYVNLLHQYGMYAELSLIWGAPGTTLATYQPAAPDQDHSPAFWTSVANTFNADPGVILGVFGEPHNISWSCWVNGCSNETGYTTAGMQELVTTIRNTGGTNVIAVSCIDYANDCTQYLQNKPRDPLNQMIAEAHVYGKNTCATPTCFTSELLPVAQSLPMLWGEVGETYDASDCGSSIVSVNIPWALANTTGVEAWTWDTWNNCSTLIANYSGTPYSGYGQWVKNYYAQLVLARDLTALPPRLPFLTATHSRSEAAPPAVPQSSPTHASSRMPVTSSLSVARPVTSSAGFAAPGTSSAGAAEQASPSSGAPPSMAVLDPVSQYVLAMLRWIASGWPPARQAPYP